MAVELASGYVTMTVKTGGASAGLGKLFGGAQKQALGAGKKTGEAYRKSLEAELKTTEAQVKKTAEAVAKARDKEADAAGKLRVATEKLNDARKKGVDGGRLAQLEENQASAKRKHASATSELARQNDALARSQERATKASKDLESAASKSSGGLLSRFKVFGRDSGRAFNSAASSELSGGSLASAGAAAGQKVKGGFLRGIGKATALAAPFVGVGAIVSKGWGRMVAIDNAQAKMRQFGIEGERLDTVMGQITKSVTGTSFGLGDAASVAAQALSAGVKEGEDLAQHMQTIVDTAAYGQVPLEEMGTIMNRAKISGKVLSEDLNMLGDRGTPVFAWLQEDLGKSGEELAKFISDGNLKYEQLNATLQKHAQGAGQRSGETFTGALSNLSAAAGRMGEKLLTPIFKPLQSGIVWMTEAFNKIGPTVESTVGGIAAGVASFVSGSLVPAVQSMMPTIQALLPVLLSIGKSIIGAFKDAVGFIIRFKDFLIPLVAGLVAYKAAVVVIGAVTKAWAAIQALLNVALTANPIGIVVAAIAALVAGIVIAYNKSETFRNIVQAAWTGIKAAVSGVWNFLKTTVFDALVTVFKTVGAVVTGFWKNIVSPAFNGIKAVAGFMWEVVSDIFNNWKKAFQVAAAVATALWHAGVKPAFDWIKGGIQAAWDFVSPIFEKFKAGWDAIKSGFVTGANAIKDGVSSAFNGLAGIIKAPLKALGGFLAGIPTSIMGIDIPGADSVRGWGEKLQGLRRGGVVRGPGTGTSDSVLAWLSNGEGVVTARAMSNGGAGIVQALNQGWVPSAAYLRDMLDAPGYAGGLGPGASYLRSLVMQLWPQITTIGGVRDEDGYGEHSSGNALDIMIPNYQSPEGQAMGEQIAAFLRKNATALQLDGFIWRQQSYGYGGSLTSGQMMKDQGNDTVNHMDHVHVMLGKGRRAGAAKVAAPSIGLSLPNGLSGGRVGGSSGGKSGYSVGGKTISEETRSNRLATNNEQLEKARRDIEISERELAEAEATGKTKATTLERKRNRIADQRKRIEKLEAEVDELESAPWVEGSSGSSSGGGKSGGGKSGGNDPFSKIFDGFGELAQVGVDGLMESFLPPGFSDPTEWGLPKMAGGIMNFIGGLMPEGPGRAIFGMLGAGVTGDAAGAASALGGLFRPQDSNILTGVDSTDMGGAFTGAPAPHMAMAGAGGTSVDNSVTINNAPYQDSTQQVMQNVQGRQMAKQRGHLGTKRIN